MEDYKKKYEETLENIKRIKAANKDNKELMDFIDFKYPELKESEDERIRKDIISLVKETKVTDRYYDLNKMLAWLEKQGEKTSDKIVEKAKTEKQRVLLTETDGSANIDWDCRSLDDAKILLKCGLEFIHTIETDIQVLTDNRFGGCFVRVPTRYDKGIKQGEQNRETVCSKCRKEQPSHSCSDITALGRCYIEGEQNSTNKNEPRFKVGDWVIYECGEDSAILQIENIVYETYEFTDNSTLNVVDENTLRPWTIQDAKDGDILQLGLVTVIFKELTNFLPSTHYCHCYCSYCNDIFEVPQKYDIYGCIDAKPVTKEQRDLLFQKMKEAGYLWDADKKQLKKIEQKPVWSDDDEKDLFDAAEYLREYTEKYVQGGNSKQYILDLADRIESLRPQNTWKPSDEQIEAFEHFVRSMGESGYASPYDNNTKLLYSLLSDLKKLKVNKL